MYIFIVSFTKGDITILEEQYDFFHELLIDFYMEDINDLYVMDLIGDLLLPHYEEKKDYERLGFLYLCLGFTNLELSRVMGGDYGRDSVVYYEKLLGMIEHMDEVRNPRYYRWIGVAFANLIIVEPSLSNISMEKSYQYWIKMQEQLEDGTFDICKKEAPQAIELIEQYIVRFENEAYGNYMDSEEPKNEEILSTIEDITEKAYRRIEKETGDVMEHMPELAVNYLRLSQKRGTMSDAEIWEKFHEGILEKSKKLDPQRDDIVSFYVATLQQVITLTANMPMTEREKQGYLREYLDIMEEFIRGYGKATYTAYTINNAMAVLAFQPTMYKCIADVESKIQYIYRMVITRHMNTFQHSTMVSHLAACLLTGVLEYRPELLVGCHDLHSLDDVELHKEELLRFIRNAALLHDIGKSEMVNIIDTQFRPLFDKEFWIIREHPIKGAKLLEVDEALLQFRDIVLGHHKYYNGKGGYPRDFDNCASKDRLLIDIISICDCLDAATDTYGRNYRNAKTCAMVLEEFAAAAGVQYNPDLVALLEEHPSIKDDMQELIEHKAEKVREVLRIREMAGWELL